MADVKLHHIYKVYPNGVKAVNDFCIDIQDKEFIVFVGPSGCGKSTTLRMVAGLEEITAGECRIGDKVVNDVEPKDRDIAMVFQNYALYPHMTVYDNMAFGLRLKKVYLPKVDRAGNPVLDEEGNQITVKRHYTKKEIDKRVTEAAEVLGITEYLKRKPKAMSGGQRQRVALGRAIVRHPKVFLLDEPLSNLDAKLRASMRSEISKLHHKLQTTFIYVTHDQVEAMTMGTRIVVMKLGFVQQIDTPKNLYRYPTNKFVAGFIGTPQMNFFNGKAKLDGDKIRLTFDNTKVDLLVPREYFYKADRAYLDGKKPVTMGIRCEHVSVDPNEYPFKAKCRVSHIEELGIDCQVFADFNIDSEETVAESPTRVIIKAPTDTEYEPGEIIEVSLDLSKLHIFDAETEDTIVPRIPHEVRVEAAVSKGKLQLLGTEIDLPSAIDVKTGKYLVGIAPDAISFDGEIAVNVDKEENINGTRLAQLSVGSDVIFAIAQDEQLGKKAKIAIDLKKLNFYKNDEKVFAALNLQNVLDGKTIISRVKSKVSPNWLKWMLKDKSLTWFSKKYTFDIAGEGFDCHKEKVDAIISSGGLNVFKKELQFKFSPYEVIVSNNGISATVKEVLDYGKEKFAVCETVGGDVIVKVDDDFDQQQVKLSLDIDTIIVWEKARDIRLV